MEPSDAQVTIRFAEGTRTFQRGAAPSPTVMWEALHRSETPALLFDFDSAYTLHANTSLARTLAVSSTVLQQSTGRMLTPPRCHVLTDVISAQLHAHSAYAGPYVLHHGDLGHRSLSLTIDIVSHHGYRYGINTLRPLQLLPLAERSLLLVDDEPLVLRAIRRVCARMMPVQAATDAYSAIRLLVSDPSISVVLSDIDMPGPSGIQLLEACRLFRPDLAHRFILYSGRDERPPVHADVPFLRKPVPLALLRQTIEQVRDR